MNSEDRTFFITIFKKYKISEEKSVTLGNIEKISQKVRFKKKILLIK